MTDAPQNGAARPMSRRARREAERSAEREAFLTGQQPLLTRREMRRLREEQEALREAVASGELTVDEAQALQSPMAEMDIKSHTLHEHNSFEPIREPLLGSGPGDGPSRANAAPSTPGFPSAPAASAPVAAPSTPVVTPGDDLRDTRVVPTAASRMPEGAGHTTAPTFPPVNTAAANTANAANGGNGPAVGLPTHLASSSPTAGSAASFGISAASATSAGAGPLGGQAPTGQPVVHVNSAHAGAPSLPTYPARSRRAASAASAGMASSASAYSSLSAASAAHAVEGRASRRRANAASAPSSFSATAASATAASADLASRAGTRSRRRAAASAASAPSIFSATAASADLAGVNAVSARSAASAPSALSGTAASAASANSAVSDLGADLPRRRTVFNAVSAPTPSAAPRVEPAPASPFLPVHSVLANQDARPAAQSVHSAELPVAQSAPQPAPVVAPGGSQQGPLWQSVSADRTHQQAPSADEAGDWNVSTAAYAPVNEPLADAQPAPGQAEAAPMRRRSLLGGNAQPAPTPVPTPAANETPARRPIVRAPSVAKGVREVDTNTGELTIIKPANPNPPVVQRTPEMVSTQDEFENEVVPNWGAFSQARANQQANSAPNEALADTGLYDHLEDDESSQDGRGLRIFLTMLLIIVLALVVAAVVWFVVLDGGSTNAQALGPASLLE